MLSSLCRAPRCADALYRRARENSGMNPDDIVAELVRHNLLEEMASYVRRGRRFSALAVEEAHTQWLTAARRFVRGADPVDMDDLGAELRLRGAYPPEEQVAGELAWAVAEMRARE